MIITTEKSYVKLYVYVQFEFKCITVTLYIFSFCFFFLAESKIDTFIRYIIFRIGKGFSL